MSKLWEAQFIRFDGEKKGVKLFKIKGKEGTVIVQW